MQMNAFSQRALAIPSALRRRNYSASTASTAPESQSPPEIPSTAPASTADANSGRIGRRPSTLVLWAAAAWCFGIPTSESHALIAGLSGAAIALHGGFAGINGGEWIKVHTNNLRRQIELEEAK